MRGAALDHRMALAIAGHFRNVRAISDRDIIVVERDIPRPALLAKYLPTEEVDALCAFLAA